MKRPGLSLCLFSMVLIIFLVAPVNAESPTISSFSPTVAYQGSTATVTITGTNFNTSSVLLMRSGKENVTPSSITLTSTEIVCIFTGARLSEIDAGAWYPVVINADKSEFKANTAFTIRAPITLTSINPVSARTNNVTRISVVGTGLSDITSMYLYNSDYTNISATDVNAISSTMVNGTIALTSAKVDTYQVCVKDTFGTPKCGLSFKITSDAVGSLDLSSSPSGASVLLDGTVKGTTPITIKDLDVGSYKLIIKKEGYTDWMRTAKVTNGGTTSYDAVLEAKTVATTAPTSVPTTAPTTVRTTRVSTITVPTKWVDTPTAAPASPLEGAVILGAIGIGIIAIRRKD